MTIRFDLRYSNLTLCLKRGCRTRRNASEGFTFLTVVFLPVLQDKEPEAGPSVAENKQLHLIQVRRNPRRPMKWALLINLKYSTNNNNTHAHGPLQVFAQQFQPLWCCFITSLLLIGEGAWPNDDTLKKQTHHGVFGTCIRLCSHYSIALVLSTPFKQFRILREGIKNCVVFPSCIFRMKWVEICPVEILFIHITWYVQGLLFIKSL